MSTMTPTHPTSADAAAHPAALFDACLAPTYPSANGVAFVDGEGCRLVDDRGNRHLDMTSGIAVLALGHRSPVVADALRRAADGLVHTSNLFCTPPGAQLAAELVRRSFADRVFLCNSGTEAMEGAIKFARLRSGPERREIVTFAHGFHGRTMGALAATDRPADETHFGPLPGGFVRGSFADPAALDLVDEHTCAVIVEPIQGEGGVHPAPASWLQALRRRCDETGTLLVFDEIQCGLGRTGRLWAHEHAGVTPDLMTLAKPLGGGLPIGAVLMTADVASAITPGSHGSTFGGGPAVATVARAVLDAVDDAMLAEVRRKGERLRSALEAIDSPLVRDVRGRGLMLGVGLSEPVAPVLARARELGLLLVPAGGDTVRFLPPLVATDEDLDEAVRLFAQALHDHAAGDDA